MQTPLTEQLGPQCSEQWCTSRPAARVGSLHLTRQARTSSVRWVMPKTCTLTPFGCCSTASVLAASARQASRHVLASRAACARAQRASGSGTLQRLAAWLGSAAGRHRILPAQHTGGGALSAGLGVAWQGCGPSCAGLSKRVVVKLLAQLDICLSILRVISGLLPHPSRGELR